MKIILDTNVLIAAFISRGNCHEVFEYCALNHQIILSKFIIQEFTSKLATKFKFHKKEINQALQILRSRSKIKKEKPFSQPVCRDKDDDHILALLNNAQVDAVVTGDQDLLCLKFFQEIPVISPTEFWKFEKEFKA